VFAKRSVDEDDFSMSTEPTKLEDLKAEGKPFIPLEILKKSQKAAKQVSNKFFFTIRRAKPV